MLYRFKQLLEQNEARISKLISEEHGKTLEDAAGELKRGIENVEYACAAPEILRASTAATSAEHRRLERLPADRRGRRDHPVQLPGDGAAVDVPAGHRLRQHLHPQASERDPSSTLLIAELFHEAGLPKGVLNVVHGDKEAVDGLLQAPEVKAISFVGSTPSPNTSMPRAPSAASACRPWAARTMRC